LRVSPHANAVPILSPRLSKCRSPDPFRWYSAVLSLLMTRVPVKFVGTEIALHAGKNRNSLIRNLQVKRVGMDTRIKPSAKSSNRLTATWKLWSGWSSKRCRYCLKDSSGGPFSRKTDGTELQKPPNRKFFYPFPHKHLRRLPPQKNPPNFAQKRRPL